VRRVNLSASTQAGSLVDSPIPRRPTQRMTAIIGTFQTLFYSHGRLTEADVREALRTVEDPELGVNIVDLGLVYASAVSGGDVAITMTLTSPACPLREYIESLIDDAVFARLPSVDHLTVDIVSHPLWSPDMMTEAARRQLA